MSLKDSNTPVTQRLLAYWRQRYLWRWQTSYEPRLCWPDNQIPRFVHQCPVTQPLMTQLRLLDWEQLPRPTRQQWFGRQSIPLAAYIGAYFVKLIHQIPTMGHLHRFLATHPALVWALGFPLVADPTVSHGFAAGASLPTRRQLNRVLTKLDNDLLQRLLTAQVKRLQALLPDTFGQTISLDTSHIVAWVKENNPREYIKEGRYDKNKQPAGDPDCKVGCKRRHNRLIKTPAKEGKPASEFFSPIGEYYWGYASGAVVTKVPDWGEFILAEMTDTFDKGDVRFFFPLLTQVEQRLSFRPRYGAFDAAFDAFYVYEHFHGEDHDGFAAVPLNKPKEKRSFAEDDLPLCAAGLPMPVRKHYNDRTKAIIPHRRAVHACPLLYPQPTGESCPVAHKQWTKKGCSVNLPVTLGPRLRYQLDRDSDQYKAVYAQRTAVERIFSQAKALGIERPKLRNQRAIANYNTLAYLLINLWSLQRVLNKCDETDQ